MVLPVKVPAVVVVCRHDHHIHTWVVVRTVVSVVSVVFASVFSAFISILLHIFLGSSRSPTSSFILFGLCSLATHVVGRFSFLSRVFV